MLDLSKYPKILKTKEDYIFIKNNFPFKYWMEDFISLETDAYEDIVVGILIKTDNDAKPFKIIKKFDLTNEKDKKDSDIATNLLNNETKYMILSKGEFEEEPEWSIYATEDSNKCFGTITIEKEDSKMKQLGFTKDEIDEILMEVNIDEDEEDGNNGE